jgi:hypothetical protein
LYRGAIAQQVVHFFLAIVPVVNVGVDAEPPRITTARGPPLLDGCDAPMGEGVEVAPDWDEAVQPWQDFEVDQRIS